MAVARISFTAPYMRVLVSSRAPFQAVKAGLVDDANDEFSRSTFVHLRRGADAPDSEVNSRGG